MKSRRIKICVYNLENLFLSLEYYGGEDLSRASEETWRNFALAQLKRKQKSLCKTQGLAKAMLDINADVFLCVEVGGKESLENLNRYFLNEGYEVHFVPGNSKRSIDLGFLVRKGFFWEAVVGTNKELPIEVSAYQGNYLSKFSRDVAELRFFSADKIKMILLLTHLKSKISSDQDFRGNDVRTAEARALVELYKMRRHEFPNLPIVMGGDFNSDLTSLELEPLQHTDLLDLHEILETPEPERCSYIYFDSKKDPKHQVLDYLLLSPELRDRVVRNESGCYRYKGFYDIPHELPQTQKERRLLPSDHYPVVLCLATQNWSRIQGSRPNE